MLMKLSALLLVLCLSVVAADSKLGKPLILKTSTPIADILASPDKYTGKTVQVKGKVTEVCEMMGCWTNLLDSASGKMIKVKVTDGDIVFPKDAVGKTAIAEGELKKFELTKEQAIARAKHEAEEQGRTFNPASVKSGATIYQIQGTGAVIVD
jgi:hypothetical protein